ncbi:B-cell receptor CD22-like [Lepidochelys kempii]|uniref:B-cell receptor CD22-like n=1 Tax=Lepidochelys kempii TaxID=8472 RepID=UPI003C6F53DE
MGSARPVPPINITVLYAPTGVHVTAASGTSPQAGKSVTLTCSYTSSLPAPNSYTWYRGDQQLEGSRREMVLKSITAEQAGEYRCQADNGIDAPTGVHVTAAPGTSPQAGESVTLTCSYTRSLPAPNSYTWYWGDQQLKGSRQEMVLKSITVEQAGEYRCQANNGIGQSPSPPINITVLCKCRGPEKRDLRRCTLAMDSCEAPFPSPRGEIVVHHGKCHPAGQHSLQRRLGVLGREGFASEHQDQPGPGETPMSERIYENTQHYGMGKPACLAPPGAPSAPTEVCPGSPDSTRESHIYSQPMNTGKVPQSDPDEVHYAAVQLQPLTRRAEPVADLTCEYAVIKS